MNDIATSMIRTFVPYLVSSVLAWLGTKGLHVSSEHVASATAQATVAVGTVYYLAVRSLETKYPKLGYLLGVPSKPTYM